VYPYELVPMLAGEGGTFVEHDLDDAGALAPVDRPPGLNKAGVVTGVVTTPTTRYPEGVTRVAVLGDPTRAMGSITEECFRLAGFSTYRIDDLARVDEIVRIATDRAFNDNNAIAVILSQMLIGKKDWR